MIVLVTGATAGFGAEMARKFVGQGHKVIAAGRRRERLDTLAGELGAALLPVEMDVTSKDSIDAALAALPEEQRVAIVLVDLEGMPVAEAAHVLGVPTGTVKSRCSRGRARLALSLGHLRNRPGGAAVPPGDDEPLPLRARPHDDAGGGP